MKEDESQEALNEVTQGEYKYGFVTDIEMDTIPKGLSEDVVRMISAKKGEPAFMLEFRLESYRKWLTMPLPNWAHLSVPPIDFNEIIFYAAPKKQELKESLDYLMGHTLLIIFWEFRLNQYQTEKIAVR